MPTVPASHNDTYQGSLYMRVLRVSVFVILAAALAIIGIAPRKIFAQKHAQTIRRNAHGQHATRHQRLHSNVVAQQQPATTLLQPSDFAPSFAKQLIGTTSDPLIVTITNTSASATITISGSSSDQADYSPSGCVGALAPNATCQLSITFTPTAQCSEPAATISIMSDDPGGTLALTAIGYGYVVGGIAPTDLKTQPLTATQLAQSLVGTGVAISNATYTGATLAAGKFTNGSAVVGFDSGIILSNGALNNVIGPNCDAQISFSNNTPGDTDLSALIGQVTNDAAVLEFDFNPSSPTIRFQYVFASDEYEDFVFDFNDVFAFFVNGQNVALIPQTNTLVSINNVNNGNNGLGDHPEYAGIPAVNPTFYINNDLEVLANPPLNTEMDGMTVVLTASAAVNPGSANNHIKLVIADAIDTFVDSNVFIKGGSLSSSIVSLSPTGLAFGNVTQGAQSTAQTVTLTNVGNVALTGVNISADSNNFTLANNTCGTSVAAGASCTIDVKFSPQGNGMIQGALNFTDSAGDSPQPATLAGTGVSGPFASVSPRSLTFGPQPLNGTSGPQTVTITNTGTSVLTIGSISVADLNANTDFQITNESCISGSIAVNGTCTVTLTWTNSTNFTPESDQLVIQDDAPDQQQIVALVGGAATSTVTVLPTPLAFGNQTVNTTSAPKTVTISNTGNAVVTVPSIIVPPGFAETDNCVSSGGLVPVTSSGQNSCAINVTFTPTSAVAFGGNMVITDSATGAPHTVGLSGTGTVAAVTLVSIAVTPNPATVAVNGQVQFTATGTFSDQTTKDVTTQSTWTSSDTGVATIGAATGLATGVAISDGPLTITAKDGNITGTAQLNVTGSSVTLTSIVVTPNPATVGVGGTIQFTATGHFSDGTTRDITTGSTWSSSDTEVATIDPETGLAMGVAVSDGAITIRATAVGTEIFGTAQLTVSNAPITLTIQPPPGGTFGPVNPGGTLPVGVVLTANPGFTGTVTFSCTTDSPTITCDPRPASVTITSNGPLQVAIVVDTFCKGFLAPLGINPGGFGGGLALLLLLSTMLAGTAWTFRKNPRWALSFALFVLAALGGVACNSLPRGANGVTQPGDYTLTISATVNGQTVSAPPVHFHVN
jgi:Big-like domain-containing protein/ASPM-SPD-2-Hydin domain-containing protein